MVADEPVRSVAIYGHAMQRNFLPSLVRRLKAEHGCKAHLYCSGPGQKRFYDEINNDGLFDTISIHNVGVLEIDPETHDADDVFIRARAWEKELGIGINEFMISDRHFGRGYALGGFKHPRSRLSEKTSYLQVVERYNRRMAFWDRELAEKNIDLIINGTRELVAVAMARRVPLRRLIRSRHGNYYYWAFNDKLLHPGIEAEYNKLPKDTVVERLNEPAFAYQEGRRHFLKNNGSVVRLAHNLVRRVALHAYWHWTKSEKAKGYYMTEELRYHVRAWRELRRFVKGKYRRLDDMAGTPFVYFPLQTEPEFSMNMQSPEYFFQQPTIAQVCRDLPSGIPLLVKETYFALGRRPENFYDQICDLKNAALMDLFEPGVDVIKQATVTVTVTGSAGHEAAVMGKPVVSFGRHNPYNFLPHVKVVRDGAELKGHLEKFLAGDFDQEQAQKDGQRYLQAMINVSFDMGDFNYMKAGAATNDAVIKAHGALIESLAWAEPRISHGEHADSSAVARAS